jgi:multidrug efflux pump subunit AcrA (membrane-fusion protein)
VLTAAELIVRGAFFGAPSTFPAVVTPPSISYLQFLNEGAITAVNVHPGQSVKRGAVLATQNTAVIQARLSYDQASLAGDQAIVAALPGAQSAVQHRLSLEVTLAQQELSGAESELAIAQTPQQQATANAALTSARTRLVLAENALSGGGGNPSLGAAQAAVGRDEASVASDQVALQEAALLAPVDGVIAYVGGTVGDLAGAGGVSGGSMPSVPVPSSAGFNLFPPAAQAPAISQGGTPPMIAFYPAGLWQVVAVVPQASIFSVHVGESAAVTLVGRSGTLPAHVVRISGSPIYSNGAASYDVVLSLNQDLGDQLLGMAADVTLGASH